MFMNFHSLSRVNSLQNNKLKTKSKNDISHVWAEVQSSFNLLHCRKRGQKGHLSLFFQNVTLGILMMYFVSCLEMEIKYMCLLNNAQYTTL
uniref:Uncharacterized protein n=1 Tax=Rhinopithecus roxellana TaxID=61622 RepID=A0A2K6NKF5_RHIRO